VLDYFTFPFVGAWPPSIKPTLATIGWDTVPHRTFYALGRLFVTRTDSSGRRFNYSEPLGNASVAALSNIYHAPEHRT